MDEIFPCSTLLISGHARIPQESPAKALYNILSITAEVDIASSRVLSADITLVTETARNFVRGKIVGMRLLEDSGAILRVLEFGYHGGAKKAVLAAVVELQRNAATALETVRALDKPAAKD